MTENKELCEKEMDEHILNFKEVNECKASLTSGGGCLVEQRSTRQIELKNNDLDVKYKRHPIFADELIEQHNPGPRVDYTLYGDLVGGYRSLNTLTRPQLYSLDQVVFAQITHGNNIEDDFLLSSSKQSNFATKPIKNMTEYKVLDVDSQVVFCPSPHGNDIEDVNLKSLDDICKKDDEEPDNWWCCTKCHKKIIKGEYHKKYCNSKKDKHKHKLQKDYTKQFVKNKCCFRCGRKDHYISDCIYPKIN